MLTWSQTYLCIIDLVVSHLFVLGAYTGMGQEFCPQVVMCGRGACMVMGGVHGREACLAGSHAWWGECMAGDMHDRGSVHGRGACVAGAMCGRRDGH